MKMHLATGVGDLAEAADVTPTHVANTAVSCAHVSAVHGAHVSAAAAEAAAAAAAAEATRVGRIGGCDEGRGAERCNRSHGQYGITDLAEHVSLLGLFEWVDWVVRLLVVAPAQVGSRFGEIFGV